MNGYAGEILRIDLSSDSIKTEELDIDIAEKFLGGRGLGVKILYDELERGIDPLGEENKMIFVTGPVTGTAAPTAGRYIVAMKSPLTGGICFPNCGGSLGSELKYAGWDAIIIEGRAADPTYIWIDDEEVEIRSADRYWGLDAEETQEVIRRDDGEDVKVACIGPAGENLVKYAVIRNDHRVAARNGPGAVMGSKNLKALTVRGTGDVTVSDMDGFRNACNAILDKIRKYSVTKPGESPMYTYGTAAIYDMVNMAGALATRNYQSHSGKDARKISPTVWSRTILKGKRACFGCPIACGRWIGVDKGPYAGTLGEGPEFQVFGMFGSNCEIYDANAIAKANDMCNKLGLDSLSTGNVISFSMECFEKGLISKEDAGVELKFGNDAAMVEVIEKIANREGIGDLLAEGVKRASEKIGRGADRYAMHMKGLELTAYDCRGAFGQALSYATSNRGGVHMDAWAAGPEFAGQSSSVHSGRVDRQKKDGKALFVKNLQDWMAVLNSTIMCVFSGYETELSQFADVVSKATGFDIDEKEYMRMGERSFILERMFNAREGFGRKDDMLPSRFLEEPLKGGASKGKVVPLDEMLDEYYELRGLDKEGHPTSEKMKELGL
jgi:aldehyde:ferredoxin oxidoreductase